MSGRKLSLPKKVAEMGVPAWNSQAREAFETLMRPASDATGEIVPARRKVLGMHENDTTRTPLALVGASMR